MSRDTATGDPQDPYKSFLVSASAGSGKTYQLSHRFLNLVGAGAAPGSILTVTFTKKAAGEMRSRILREAIRLRADSEAAAAFEEQVRGYAEASKARGENPPPPRGAHETAEQILAASQILKISTIDSLFYEWVSKFPLEASVDPGADPTEASDEAALPSPLTVMDPLEARELDERAFVATCRYLGRGLEQGDETCRYFLDTIPDGSIHELRGKLAELGRQDTYVWYGERRNPGGDTFLPHAEADAPETEASVVAELETQLRTVIAELASEEKRGRALAAVERGSLSGLFGDLLSGSTLGVSKAVIKGKKRERLAAEIHDIDGLVAAFFNREKLARLNRQGRSLSALFRIYRGLRDHLKFNAGSVEFSDLAKGCHRLFTNDVGHGARYLLAWTYQHLMVDEFQDTSRLQWSIFSQVASELLAGENLATGREGPPPSVFLVGDEKQSIYGFREADPAVMSDARTALSESVEEAPLTRSYRTSQIVLDFVDETFCARDNPDFPRHETARPDGENPVVPDVGRVMVGPLVEGDDDAGGEEKEAQLVAEVLARSLSGELPTPVYDKDSGGLRSLRPSDCAILYRSGTHAAAFEEALRARQIPCLREEEKGFFARPEIADATALLRYLALPGDLVSLATVLRSPLGRVDDSWLLDALATTTPARGSRGQTASAPADDLLGRLGESRPHLAGTLRSLVDKASLVLPHELLTDALTRLGGWQAYTDPAFYEGAETELARRNLFRLVELCMNLEDGGRTNPLALVEHLEKLAHHDELGNAAAGSDAVRLMTIHKAKGLEFPFVVLADTGRAWGQMDRYWARGGGSAGEESFGVYYVGTADDQPHGDAAFDGVKSALTRDITDETQRLLYVALTRAQHHVLVTGHKPGRRFGIEETVYHGVLEEAFGRAAGSAAGGYEVAETQVQVWERHIPGSEELEAGSPEASPAGDPAAKLAIPHAAKPEIPHEIRCLAPSAGKPTGEDQGTQDGAKASVGSQKDAATVPQRLPPNLARAAGIFVHKGLECFVGGTSFAPEAAWKAALSEAGCAPDGNGAEPTRGEAAYSRATAELSQITENETFRRFVNKALQVWAERPVVHLTGDRLVQGTLDLLVQEDDNTWWVVDYKSSFGLGWDPSTAGEDTLRAFCNERGYTAQVSDYAAAVKAMEPEAKVQGVVLFTAGCRFLNVAEL